jgi:peptide/nickel transport system substrate-binding protein
MKDLGIKVEIQELSPSAWAGLLSNPETADHAFGLVWWPTLATPYDYMWSIFDTQAQKNAGYNWGYYSNPQLDKLLDSASAEPMKKAVCPVRPGAEAAGRGIAGAVRL